MVFSVPYHGNAPYPGLILILSLILAPILVIVGSILIFVNLNNLSLSLYSLGAIVVILYVFYNTYNLIKDILAVGCSGGCSLFELVFGLGPMLLVPLFFIFSVIYLWQSKIRININ